MSQHPIEIRDYTLSLMNQGMSNEEAAADASAKYGVTVYKQTVATWRKNAGIAKATPKAPAVSDSHICKSFPEMAKLMRVTQ